MVIILMLMLMVMSVVLVLQRLVHCGEPKCASKNRHNMETKENRAVKIQCTTASVITKTDGCVTRVCLNITIVWMCALLNSRHSVTFRYVNVVLRKHFRATLLPFFGLLLWTVTIVERPFGVFARRGDFSSERSGRTTNCLTCHCLARFVVLSPSLTPLFLTCRLHIVGWESLWFPCFAFVPFDASRLSCGLSCWAT